MGFKLGQGSLRPGSEPEPEPAPGPVVTIYTDTNYKGLTKELGAGQHKTRPIMATMLWGSALRSVRVGPGLRVTMYKEPNFQGPGAEFTEDTPDIGSGYMDTRASFIVVAV